MFGNLGILQHFIFVFHFYVVNKKMFGWVALLWTEAGWQITGDATQNPPLLLLLLSPIIWYLSQQIWQAGASVNRPSGANTGVQTAAQPRAQTGVQSTRGISKQVHRGTTRRGAVYRPTGAQPGCSSQQAHSLGLGLFLPFRSALYCIAVYLRALQKIALKHYFQVTIYNYTWWLYSKVSSHLLLV